MPKPSVETCPPEEPYTDQQVLCVVNTGCNQLEVADSEDNLNRENAAQSEVDSCISSSKKNSLECEFILGLSRAIGTAKHLQFLDLSNNGFTEPVAEALYNAWSSRLGAGLAWKHIKDQIVHFSIEASKCCKVRSCCRKD
uniref:Uncharacterized protein n=1 Tax=Rhizophora mucronata TaxID=61149 RepID=A0A2P2MWZ5_RHIMU